MLISYSNLCVRFTLYMSFNLKIIDYFFFYGAFYFHFNWCKSAILKIYCFYRNSLTATHIKPVCGCLELDWHHQVHGTLLRKLKIEQNEPHKKLGSKHRCSGRVGISCSTSDTHVEVNQDITQYNKSFSIIRVITKVKLY
jgi:hypothetical protein